MSIVRAALQAVAVLSLALRTSQAENHFCVDGLTVHLVMNDFSHRDVTIIAHVAHEPEHRRLEPKRCRWEISIRSSRRDLQVVLEGLSKDSRANATSVIAAEGQLQVKTATVWSPVKPGNLEVQPLESRSDFTVEASWDPRVQAAPSASLRALVPLPDLCNRDMLSFRGQCFAVSALAQSANDAVSSIRGGAQLASFSSMSEVVELIAANSARQSKFPYTSPLSLDQPVRLGMFIDATDGAVLGVVRSERDCRIAAAKDFTNLSASETRIGPCATLRLSESGRPVVELADCSRPMLSLLSFPETSRSERSFAHCNGSELSRRVEQLRSLFDSVHALARLQAASTTPGTELETWTRGRPELLAAKIAGAMLVLIAATVGAVFAWRCSQRRSRTSDSVVSEAEHFLVNPQASVQSPTNAAPGQPHPSSSSANNSASEQRYPLLPAAGTDSAVTGSDSGSVKKNLPHHQHSSISLNQLVAANQPTNDAGHCIQNLENLMRGPQEQGGHVFPSPSSLFESATGMEALVETEPEPLPPVFLPTAQHQLAGCSAAPFGGDRAKPRPSPKPKPKPNGRVPRPPDQQQPQHVDVEVDVGGVEGGLPPQGFVRKLIIQLSILSGQPARTTP